MSGQDKEPMLQEGTVIQGKWEILGHIANGGKGEVYLARQLNLDRKVALKIMSREFLASLEGDEEEIRSELDRFRREVRIMAQVRHPNVLQVFDFDQVDVAGEPLDYLVMEYVPGPTLRLTMREEGFGADEAALRDWLARLFLPVLRGVEAVHAQGIVHRDLKPANVLIDEGVPKIADFGLAGGAHYSGVTRSHHIIGTMPYMPEEQFLDLALTDARADVYALGKILYEAVEGKLTKDKVRPFEAVALIRNEVPFYRELDRIVRQATAKDRTQRTPTVHDLRGQLEALLVGRTALAAAREARSGRRAVRPILWTILAGALALLLGLGLWHHFAAGPGPEDHSLLLPAAKSEAAVVTPSIPQEGPLPDSVTGRDGAILRLVPAGEARVDDPAVPGGQREEKLPAFYMGESPVTNHQFVEFLNLNLDGLRIADKAVWKGDAIWLLLGEVVEHYEPIVFRDGRFHIMDPAAAAKPVVRVTALGASAYAVFYGRALPTMSQWRRAEQAGGLSPAAPAAPAGDMMHPALPVPAAEAAGGLQSVGDVAPDALGLRGLGANVNEWTWVPRSDGATEFHLLGGVGDPAIQDAHVERRPWEAFRKVGFRTVYVPDQGGR